MYKSVKEVESAIHALTPIQAAYFNKVVKVNLPEITNAKSILDMLKDGEKHQEARRTDASSLMFLFSLAYFGKCTMEEQHYTQLYNLMDDENQALRSLIHG